MNTVTYREYMEDAGVPVVTVLRDELITVKRFRNLPCGHILGPGEMYQESIYICDGEFTAQYECPRCWAEIEGGE